MDINSIHLADSALLINWLYWPILLYALYKAPWAIIRQKDSSNILFATCAAIFLLWQLKINVSNGLSVHLLGMTTLTLMFRWQVALIAHAMVLLGVTLVSTADFQAFAMNGMLSGVLPIAISYGIWRLNEWYLPPNYFVYIFIAAFLAAAVSMIVTGYVSYRVLTDTFNQLSESTLDEYLLIFIPLMYPEAFLTGAVISIFVIYKPQWISTFDDRRYLNRR